MASSASTNSSFVNLAASATDGPFTGGVIPSAKTGSRIAVYGIIVNQGDTTPSVVTFNSKGSGAGTAISANLKFPANGGVGLSGAGNEPLFTTNVNEGLTVTTGAGSTTGIQIIWKYVY
jgi:hypothetical protein